MLTLIKYAKAFFSGFWDGMIEALQWFGDMLIASFYVLWNLVKVGGMAIVQEVFQALPQNAAIDYTKLQPYFIVANTYLPISEGISLCLIYFTFLLIIWPLKMLLAVTPMT